VACALHVLNVAMSMRGLRRRHLTAQLMVLALGGLALTVLFGLALALDKRWGARLPAGPKPRSAGVWRQACPPSWRGCSWSARR
jgi:hypothetical protein